MYRMGQNDMLFSFRSNRLEFQIEVLPAYLVILLVSAHIHNSLISKRFKVHLGYGQSPQLKY